MATDLKGSMVAIVTPMLTNGQLDLQVFNELVEWHILEGTSAIIVVGTTGESATLSMKEHCDLVSHCVGAANKRIPIVAGTGSNSTEEALYFTNSARECGADACLLVAPYYNKPTQEGLFQHFKLVAESVDIPQILYNVPSRTGCDMELELVNRLADIDNIIALKDASGDFDRGRLLIDKCGDRMDIYSGEDAMTLDLMKQGALGAISVTANVVPNLMSQMCKFALEGNFESAELLDQKLQSLHRALFLESNPIPVKWALHQMNKIGGTLRLPLTELNGKFHVELIEALQLVKVNV